MTDDITKLHNGNASRWWVFTVNNYTNVDREQFDALCSDCEYLCYGFETGEKNGTPHLQGYLELAKPQRFSWLKKRVTRAYIATRKGSRTQARDYCFKECHEPFEYGTWRPDKQGMRNDLVSLKRKVDEGANLEELYDDHFGSMLRYGRGIKEYMLIKRRKVKTQPIECYWIYGSSGSGKTRYVTELFSNDDYYMKSNNKWWCGYSGESIVIWDDFKKTDDYKYQDLLKWCDRYRKVGETKGGTVPLTYTKIYFTSVKPPTFDEQFIRRFGDGVNITPVTSLQDTVL